jgi:methylmalonyl-CoA/ethylmalonyl-CoA epimerase
VPDIDASYRTFRERGVEFMDAPHLIADMGTYELWMASFRDLDGNPLALRTEKPKA